MTIKAPLNAFHYECCASSGRPVRHGEFYRKSDKKFIARFRCKGCGKTFSRATKDPAVHQKKRHLNETIKYLLCSGVSQRRLSLLLNVHRITISRKLKFLAGQARVHQSLYLDRYKGRPLVDVQFDEMETFEHSKLKPLAVALAVCSESRTILGFQVSSMPAKGLLAKKSRKKYGRRKDDRPVGMKALFDGIKPILHTNATLLSDQNPNYPKIIRTFGWTHKTVKGRKGCIVGQGELKKIGFDPIFSLNHTCAMLRANVNRLFRKTWCTTKKLESLSDHLWLYMDFHNQVLI